MKNAGSPTEGIEQKNRGNSKKRKLYPVLMIFLKDFNIY
jgi:hypothetical protein